MRTNIDHKMNEKEFVYFIKGKRSNNYKIGYTSRSPQKRFREIQSQNKSEELEIIGLQFGTKSTETFLHNKFARYKLERGKDWFSFTGESDYLAYINQYCFSLKEYEKIEKIEKRNKDIIDLKKNIENIHVEIEEMIKRKEWNEALDLLKKRSEEITNQYHHNSKGMVYSYYIRACKMIKDKMNLIEKNERLEKKAREKQEKRVTKALTREDKSEIVYFFYTGKRHFLREASKRILPLFKEHKKKCKHVLSCPEDILERIITNILRERENYLIGLADRFIKFKLNHLDDTNLKLPMILKSIEKQPEVEMITHLKGLEYSWRNRYESHPINNSFYGEYAGAFTPLIEEEDLLEFLLKENKAALIKYIIMLIRAINGSLLKRYGYMYY